ncbi:MAG: cytochrome ubiquinol oxidase subunit I [Alphaproteobacteria bacterium]|nr:cytochrome ubiquinol oxidase subunit I [Alphaproteobacteria bacterium]
MDFDPVLLSRIQFAFTVSFHIIFPSFTIGLASWLAVLEWRYLRTGREVFMQTYKFWVKIFAVAFGMGVVSGIVMSYQFGTNWSRFSDTFGSIMGPMLGYEVLTAFFLEASFLGIMLFGWNKVGPRLHFFSTAMVAFGTLLSAFWILAANSWMQTPAGFGVEDGVYVPESWGEIILNPSTYYRFPHMVIAAYLTTAFVVLGVGSWYLLKGRFQEQAKVMVNYASWLILILAPTQLFVGDAHGLNTLDHQPAKVAAMEGNWETRTSAPLLLFAVPDQEARTNHFEVGIPGLASWFLTHDFDGEIPGLNEFGNDIPPVGWVFYCFRVMVGIGLLMIFTGITSAILRWRGRLFETRWFLRWNTLMIPSGFVAVLAGWFVTEIGRQPWIVYGLARTHEMSSPVDGGSVAFSLAMFVIVYTIVFGSGSYYIVKLVRSGPTTDQSPQSVRTPERPLSYPQEPAE